MKAQSVRRILTLSTGALAVAVLATGGYWFLSVRPAAAASAKFPAWIEKSGQTYQYERKTVKAPDIWPVQPDALKKHITRPDLMSGESGIGVWAYVGPLPPAPRPKAAVAEAPKLPTGIEA